MHKENTFLTTIVEFDLLFYLTCVISGTNIYIKP